MITKGSTQFCLECGGRFTAHRAHQRTCTDICRGLWFRRRETKVFRSQVLHRCKQAIWDRDGSVCQVCDLPSRGFGLDIKKIRRGGDPTPENLVTVCEGCRFVVLSPAAQTVLLNHVSVAAPTMSVWGPSQINAVRDYLARQV